MESFPIHRVETDEERTTAYEIRKQVFITEQQIDPALERDEHDDTAWHWLAFADGEAVATVRLVKEDRGAKLGRMAVLPLFRRQGVGRSLMAAVEGFAKEQELSHIRLHSQASARAFYLALGYVEAGRPFLEAGIPHVEMIKEFDKE